MTNVLLKFSRQDSERAKELLQACSEVVINGRQTDLDGGMILDVDEFSHVWYEPILEAAGIEYEEL